MARLKVFAFDYALAGGPMTRSIPGSLSRQGAMLFSALRADLGALPEVELQAMPAQDEAPHAGTPDGQEPFGARLAACMRAADAVWPLASESQGLLEDLSREVLRAKRTLLGSAPGAVRIAASKLKVARVLADGGVPVVPTYSPHGPLPDVQAAWVVKPDNGAGCRDTHLFSDRSAALAWLRASDAQDYVLQPFIAGEPGSLSLLCRDGKARLLACNRERVAVRDNRFHFLGCTVNGLRDVDGSLERLAQRVAAALPTLWGYVGVDFIRHAGGILVVDVNPRLTAAYAGLHASIGCNPAGLVIALLQGEDAGPPADGRRPVSVDVASFGQP